MAVTVLSDWSSCRWQSLTDGRWHIQPGIGKSQALRMSHKINYGYLWPAQTRYGISQKQKRCTHGERTYWWFNLQLPYQQSAHLRILVKSHDFRKVSKGLANSLFARIRKCKTYVFYVHLVSECFSKRLQAFAIYGFASFHKLYQRFTNGLSQGFESAKGVFIASPIPPSGLLHNQPPYPGHPQRLYTLRHHNP